MNVERLVGGRLHQYFSNGPSRGDGAAKARRRGSDSVIDADDLRVRCAAKPTSRTSRVPAPCMQHRAAAALAMRVDDRIDRRDQPGVLQRLDDEIALPQQILARVDQCCVAQPPQMPKCLQIGVTRSCEA